MSGGSCKSYGYCRNMQFFTASANNPWHTIVSLGLLGEKKTNQDQPGKYLMSNIECVVVGLG